MTASTNDRSVIGVIFNPTKTHVLLVKRRDIAIWVLPGGGVDPTESPENAIIREILEETGLHAAIIRKVGEYTPLNRLARFTEVFECRPIEGEPSIQEETRGIDYFPIDKLPPELFHIHRLWLDDALLNRTEIIRKNIDQVSYFKLFTYFFKHPIRVARALLARWGMPINSPK